MSSPIFRILYHSLKGYISLHDSKNKAPTRGSSLYIYNFHIPSMYQKTSMISGSRFIKMPGSFIH